MNEVARNRKLRLRFGLGTFGITIGMFAVMLVAGRSLYHWYTSIPLCRFVAEFNARTIDSPIGSQQPAITEAEVVSAIEAHSADLDTPNLVRICARIVRTRRIPTRAGLFEVTPSYLSDTGRRYYFWQVILNIPTGPKSSHGLLVREIGNPVATNGRSPMEEIIVGDAVSF